MLTLTENAVAAIRTAMTGAEHAPAGLRIMVQAGGCSGFRYVLGLESEVQDDDHVVDIDGVRVLIDPDSQPHLAGVTVDFVSTLEGAGFVFDNPNAKGSCGCGKSFC